MPFYQRLGTVPRKRHIQFRDNGTLLTEEVMGLEGFVGNESILYHLQSPCRVMRLGDFEEKAVLLVRPASAMAVRRPGHSTKDSIWLPSGICQ